MIDIKKVIKIVTTYVLLTDIHQRSHSSLQSHYNQRHKHLGHKKERNAWN